MIKNSYPGRFIVIEGLDGSGHSTQANLLKNFLIKKGLRTLLTKEPTLDSQSGRKIRRILDIKEKISLKKLQELFAEDRRLHLKNLIIPALKKGQIVISDRYFFSTFAYGAASGVNLDYLFKLNKEFLMPDLTVILKVSSSVCVKRIRERGEKATLFEKKKKLAKVWQIYKILPRLVPDKFIGGSVGNFRLNLDKNCGICIINGEKQIKEVFENIKKLTLNLIENKSKLKI